MRLMQKLLFGQVWRHPARFLLTTLAIIAASVVVIWVVSGYDSLVSQFDQFADEYVGRYQYVLVAGEMPGPTEANAAVIGANWVAELARDPAVRAVDLYEADARALVLAERNLAPHAARATLDFHWHDVTTGLPQTCSGRRSPCLFPLPGSCIAPTSASPPGFTADRRQSRQRRL